MAATTDIEKHMEVIGADGVHVGTVDAVEGDAVEGDAVEGRRIRLTRGDNGKAGHGGHHHFLSSGLVAGVEGRRVRLSATGANALLLLEEEGEGWADEPRRAIGAGWGRMALGAAAIGAVGAVAASAIRMRRGGAGDEGFALRLQADGDLRLISSGKVEGTAVVGSDGARLGTIDSVMIDRYSGRVAYAVMRFGGRRGLGASLFPVPWSLLDYDVEADGYVLEITGEQLGRAPRFEPGETPTFDAAYRRRVTTFYRAA